MASRRSFILLSPQHQVQVDQLQGLEGKSGHSLARKGTVLCPKEQDFYLRAPPSTSSQSISHLYVSRLQGLLTCQAGVKVPACLKLGAKSGTTYPQDEQWGLGELPEPHAERSGRTMRPGTRTHGSTSSPALQASGLGPATQAFLCLKCPPLKREVT